MGGVVYFELAASDPERASVFYKRVFDWKFEKWPGPIEYRMVSTGAENTPGINGGVLRRHENLRGTTNTLAVDSVDASVATVVKAGGKQVIPKMPIPGVGYLTYCEDAEGNLFGMMQSDQSAK